MGNEMFDSEEYGLYSQLLNLIAQINEISEVCAGLGIYVDVDYSYKKDTSFEVKGNTLQNYLLMLDNFDKKFSLVEHEDGVEGLAL